MKASLLAVSSVHPPARKVSLCDSSIINLFEGDSDDDDVVEAVAPQRLCCSEESLAIYSLGCQGIFTPTELTHHQNICWLHGLHRHC